MSAIEKLREASEQFKLLDLPIGAYIVTREGDFVDCNDQVRKILQLAGETLPKSIKDFYYDRDERDTLLQEIEAKLQVNPDEWMEKIIRLRIGGRDKFIKDNSRAIFDPVTRMVIGFLCCMTDVTREESYNRLYTSLPIGLYKLDERDRIVEINKAAIEMLGYDDSAEIESREIGSFFANAEEKENFTKLVHDGEAADQKVELLKGNDEPMFVSISAYRVISEDNEYLGQEGSMMDVTSDALYRRLLENIDSFPVGLYQVKIKDGKDIITDCNKQFAIINGFDDIYSAIGFDARLLHASEESYKVYMTALQESGEEPLHDYLLPIRTKKGKEAKFEVNTQMLFDRSGTPVGRAGAMRDISEKANLKQKVEDLTDDIGRVLHTYSTSLVRMQISIGAVRQSLEPDPFDETYNLLPERASEELTEPAKLILRSVNELLAKMSSSEWGATALPAFHWQRLRILADVFQNYQVNYPPVEHSPTLRTASFEVLDILERIQKGRLAREHTRQLRRDTRELLRICNLISLHQLLDGIVTMEHPVFALREFVTADRRQNEKKKPAKISSLISQTTQNMHDFAVNRGVSFRLKIACPDAKVEVNEREVVRAFDNLLHNAIKYSWERRMGEPPWIHIRANATQTHVFIEFENWGVPIPKDEIDRGLVYRTGFRGRMSSDRGRVGTGIGLADARQVARQHNGEAIIKSAPAVFGRSADDLNQPFLTTATIMLPIFLGEGI